MVEELFVILSGVLDQIGVTGGTSGGIVRIAAGAAIIIGSMYC